MSLVAAAAHLAERAHADQVRKYTGQPYIIHPLRVAGAVSLLPNASDEMIAAAWLHDVLEDTMVPVSEIRRLSADTAFLVLELTSEKYTNLPREERKRIQCIKMSNASYYAKLIKCCDRIDNLNDLPPGEFREMYAKESLRLLEAMDNGPFLKVNVIARLLQETAKKFTPESDVAP